MDKGNMHHVTVHKEKKPWYKRVWLWIIVIIVLIGIAGASGTKQNTSSSPSTEQSAPAQWDVEAAYTKVSNGMTKAQVNDATGKQPDNCIESETAPIGKSESCTYGNLLFDKGIIVISFMENKVISKTKTAN